MQKIILFYKFSSIADPDAVKLWQKNLTNNLNLRGRIIVSHQGINGTVGGNVEDLKKYIKENKLYSNFKDIVYKWSDGSREDFPRMSVKNRKELVGFHIQEDEIKINKDGIINGGIHLKPSKVNEMIEKYGDDVIFFDGRNAHEAKIGKFKNAIVPNTNTSRDFKSELDSDKYNDIKNKKVITYCTGGIRCEVISAMMKNRGFKEVYQIDGGIVKYGEKYKDDSLWEGKLRVFDNRMVVQFSEKAKDIGECIHCKSKTSNFENCLYPQCNELVLICEKCKTNPKLLYHDTSCQKKNEKLLVN